MCKLVVGISEKQNNNEFERYIEAQTEDLIAERDGMGAMVLTRDSRIHIFRSLTEYGEVMRSVFEVIADVRLVAIHTRTGTSGERSLPNVHCFEHEGYVLAHNGYVMKYHNAAPREIGFFDQYDMPMGCKHCIASKKGFCKRHKPAATIAASGECDSLQFLKALTKPASTRTLTDDARAAEFVGAGFVFSRATQEAFWIAAKKTYAQVGDGFMMLYSYQPPKAYEVSAREYVHGIALAKSEVVELSIEPRVIANGVFKIDY